MKVGRAWRRRRVYKKSAGWWREFIYRRRDYFVFSYDDELNMAGPCCFMWQPPEESSSLKNAGRSCSIQLSPAGKQQPSWHVRDVPPPRLCSSITLHAWSGWAHQSQQLLTFFEQDSSPLGVSIEMLGLKRERRVLSFHPLLAPVVVI